MSGVQSIGESLELGVVLSIVFAGLNALWGIFLLPLGLIGIIFALVDVFLSIYLKKIKNFYNSGDYNGARNGIKIAYPIGVIFGFVFLGIYFYFIYLSLEELIIKSHIIRDIDELTPVYASPKIPINKK